MDLVVKLMDLLRMSEYTEVFNMTVVYPADIKEQGHLILPNYTQVLN